MLELSYRFQTMQDDPPSNIRASLFMDVDILVCHKLTLFIINFKHVDFLHRIIFDLYVSFLTKYMYYVVLGSTY